MQLEQVHGLYTRHRGLDHPDTLQSMHSLATSYGGLNRRAEALKLREETLAAQRRVLPPDHVDTLRSMNNLANSYDELGRHVEAVKLREETLATVKRVLGPDHPLKASCTTNLANSYDFLGRHEDALKLRKESLGSMNSIHNLAVTYQALGRHAEALELYEKALAAKKKALPPNHPSTLVSMCDVAHTYGALGRHADALKLHEVTLAARRRVLPPDHPHTFESMNAVAHYYAILNRHGDALKLREETLAAQKRVLPADHPDTLKSMRAVAVSLVKLDRGAEAVPIIDDCVTRAAGKPVDPAVVPAVMDLRLRHFQKASDPAGCRATAAMWEKLDRRDAASLYTAACWRAVASAMQAKAGGADAARLAGEDADRAMEWLTKAVAAGYKDRARIEKDADLVCLREREDFKKLLATLPLPHPRPVLSCSSASAKRWPSCEPGSNAQPVDLTVRETAAISIRVNGSCAKRPELSYAIVRGSSFLTVGNSRPADARCRVERALIPSSSA